MDVGDPAVNVKLQKYCVNKLAFPLKRKFYHISIVLYLLMNYFLPEINKLYSSNFELVMSPDFANHCFKMLEEESFFSLTLHYKEYCYLSWLTYIVNGL